MTNDEFIKTHSTEDVRSLALKKVPEGIDLVWCLQQIEGIQLAQKKLTRWASVEGLWFPPKLSLEQCSSDLTAQYKQQLVERLLPQEQRTSMVDLTGGFGIDFSYIARSFQSATYIERLPHLCDIARHNFPLLGLDNANILCGESLPTEWRGNLIFADPARRDTAGRKTVALEDCTPDMTQLYKDLLSRTNYLIIKLSPMLDISQALRSLSDVREVHVVSVKGECKELLLVLSSTSDAPLTYHCVNLGTDDIPFSCTESERHQCCAEIAVPKSLQPPFLLFEPNASLLKAGCQDALASSLGLQKLHPLSNLFIYMSSEQDKHFSYMSSGQANPNSPDLSQLPGRVFEATAICNAGKKEIKTLLGDQKQANLTVRNFPTSVAELRKKWKLKEGGDTYLFATTLADGKHVVIKGERLHCDP